MKALAGGHDDSQTNLQTTKDRADYVFIVGVSRSGTELARHILNRHSLVAVCPESNYLGNLLPWEGVRPTLRRRFKNWQDDEQMEGVVQFLYGDGLRRASRWREPSRLWIWLLRRMPEDDFRQRMFASDRTDRALFATVLEGYARAKGKVVKGEKTPAHSRHAATLLRWFPNGRVIHMMRDPRAIFMSELRRRRASPGSRLYRMLRPISPAFTLVLLLQTTIAWSEAAWRGRRFARLFPDRYRIVRFEDLVRDPERQVMAISEFLGVEFEPTTLEQKVVSAGTRLGEAGFDQTAASRWREGIPSWAEFWFRVTLGRQLRRFGYG